MSLLWILVGLVGLWAGSEWALRGTIDVAERRGLSQGFLGVVVLAVGTDMPEVLVAVTAAVHQLQGQEASGVVLGNAVGSALTQGSLVLGLAGLFGHLHMSRHTLRRDGAVLLLTILGLVLLAADGELTRLEGGVLLVVYGIYAWTLRQAERRRAEGPREPWSRLVGSMVRIGIGLLVVLISSEAIVTHALELTARRGWDQTVIGLFLVGAGTSLPELALSLGAVVKGRAGLAVGNVIGSNLFDLLVPIGLSAALHPLVAERGTRFVDLPVLGVLTLLGLLFFARDRGIQRWEAWTLIGGYLVYAAFRLAST